MRFAIYARVSAFDQQPENQLAEIRRYVDARHWTAVEYQLTKASLARRTAGLASINSSLMLDGAGLTCSSAGDWIGLVATSGIWWSCWKSCRRLV